jgi:hypothetical protein
MLNCSRFSCRSSSNDATIRFTEVPSCEHIPPQMVAKDSGMSRWEADSLLRRAQTSTAGVSIATIGVLFMKTDRSATGGKSLASASRVEVGLPSSGKMYVSRVDCFTPSDTMYNVPIVNTCGFPKPITARCSGMTPAPVKSSSASTKAQHGDMPPPISTLNKELVTNKLHQPASVSSVCTVDRKNSIPTPRRTITRIVFLLSHSVW